MLAVGGAHDAAVGNHDDGAVGRAAELLAELVDQAALDLLPGLELRHGDHQHERLAAVAEVDLAGAVQLQGAQLGGNLVGARLELEEGLADGELELGGDDRRRSLMLDNQLGLGTFH